MNTITLDPAYKRHIRDSLVPVETTYEMTAKGHVYRFFKTDKGVAIKRTQADPVLWSHGYRTEAYSISERRFIDLLNCGPTEYFATLDYATNEVDLLINRD